MSMSNVPPRPSTWAQATAPTPQMERRLERQRQRTGILLGAALGLSYGLMSQFINRLALPGVPLYQPPLGPLGNSMINALVGAAFGFLTSRPNSAAIGIFLGSVASAAAIVINALLRLDGLLNISSTVVTGLLFSAPIAWFTVPVIALLRWAIERQVEALRNQTPLLTRLRAPIALVLVMAALAAFELLPGSARDQLGRTHALLQSGLAVSQNNAASLPAPLRGPRMNGFPPTGSRSYTLEWTQTDLDRFIELRPPSNYDQHAAVIARFANDAIVVCLYPTPKSEPNCGTH